MADTTTVQDLVVGDVIELQYGLGVKVVASIDTAYGDRWNTGGPTWAVHYTDGKSNAFAPSAPVVRLASPTAGS